ncbi:hypothetical protein [Antarcticimicrobium sediminis]|uniref:hypothetical protein n=1 Tax=Antarcticimicrobium sediminis TaxID=2546227 RepID=UPI0019D0E8B1|nr:hypothetical protein [Antarcticimicrobium sediminis]
MGAVFSLNRAEQVQLDRSLLRMLYQMLGIEGAETVIERASHELSLRLNRCEDLWQRGDMCDLRKCARSMIAIAEQAGMTKFASVAHDVTAAADQRDLVALSATLSRLHRVGESSLRAAGQMRRPMA